MKKLISMLVVVAMLLACIIIVPASDADAVEYVLNGEVVGDEIHVSLDITKNDLGFVLAVLSLNYNTAALEFVSVDTDGCVLKNPDMMNMGDYVLVYGEGDLNNLVDTTATGKVFTAVFKIIDAAAEHGLELIAQDNDPGI